jgi:hypothetical protein
MFEKGPHKIHLASHGGCIDFFIFEWRCFGLRGPQRRQLVRHAGPHNFIVFGDCACPSQTCRPARATASIRKFKVAQLGCLSRSAQGNPPGPGHAIAWIFFIRVAVLPDKRVACKVLHQLARAGPQVICDPRVWRLRPTAEKAGLSDASIQEIRIGAQCYV